DRGIDAGPRWKENLESRRQHSDDFSPVTAKVDRLTDDGWIARIFALPQPMTEDRHYRKSGWRRLLRRRSGSGSDRVRRLWRAVVFIEVASELNAGAQYREQIWSYSAHADLLRMPVVAADGSPSGRQQCSDRFESLRFFPEILQVGNWKRE